MLRLTRFSRRSWPPDTGLRIDLARGDTRLQVGEARPATEDRGPKVTVPARVPGVLVGCQLAALDEVRRDQQRPGDRVEAADVSVEQIRAVGALATQLGVEVEAARRQAAAADDLVQRERQILDRVRELVRVPAVLGVAPVGVDGAHHAVRDGVGHLVVEAVPRERGVVRLDVALVLAVEAVADQEPVHGLGVVVVLVLGRLHRLRLDQELALEADLGLVLCNEMEEARELLALAVEVRVEQRVVALAAAPQDVVLAAEALGHLEHVLDLRRGVGEDLGIRVGGRAGLVARVGEQVRGAPQQADAGPLLVAQGIVDEGVEVVPELGEAVALGRDVTIVEAVVRDAELREELEGGGHLRAGAGHLVGGGDPRPVQRADAEHVAAIPGERVPEADPGPEMILHPLAQDHPVGLVDLEREGVRRVWASVPDRTRHLGEERLAHTRASCPARRP